jgi:hypothetical protein
MIEQHQDALQKFVTSQARGIDAGGKEGVK